MFWNSSVFKNKFLNPPPLIQANLCTHLLAFIPLLISFNKKLKKAVPLKGANLCTHLLAFIPLLISFKYVAS